MESSMAYSGRQRLTFKPPLESDQMYYIETEQPKSDLMIFIGGLESRTTNRELLNHFGSFGIVRYCKVQCWKNNPSKCRGFAVMDVADFSTFENILLTPHRLNGRQIEVKKLIHDKQELKQQTNEIHERKIFVSSLPKKLNDLELSEFFSQFGPVELAYIIKHHRDGKSKGFGFVCFSDKTSKQKALAMAQAGGLHINGKSIVCSSYSSKMQARDKKDQFSIEAHSAEDLNSSDSGDIKEKMKSAGNQSQRSKTKKNYAQIVNTDKISNSLQLASPMHAKPRASELNKRHAEYAGKRVTENLETPQPDSSFLPDPNHSKFNLFLGAKVTSSSIVKIVPIRLLDSDQERSEL